MQIEVSEKAAQKIRCMREDADGWRNMIFKAYTVAVKHQEETEDYSENGLCPLIAIKTLSELFNELTENEF